MTTQRQGDTRPFQDDSESKEGDTPRMPHERDESSDSQAQGEPRPLMRKAHDDLAAGRVDTDRGTPAHEAYQRQKDTGQPPRKRS